MSFDATEGFNINEINLEGLTPLQRKLQLKFLACRRHEGDCRCFLTGQNPRQICKKDKKLSKSWIKSRQPKGPVETCNTCEVRENPCCDKNEIDKNKVNN